MIARPVVFDYATPHAFLQDLMVHYKSTSKFSVRQRVQLVEGCSPALVSQVLAGRRRLTRDQLPSFARLFKLQEFEVSFLDRSLTREPSVDVEVVVKPVRETKNHLLASWLHVYVKDLVNLKGFSLETRTLHRMLLGLAPEKKIQASVDFLLREGFWRRTARGKVVAEEDAVVSTNEIPNEKIRQFHKQALKVAMRGLDVFPTERRKASTVLVSVDRDRLPELKELIDGFQAQLLKFIEDHPQGGDDLMQIAIHLTPVGGKNV